MNREGNAALSALNTRVEQLERQNRRMRTALTALVLVPLALCFTGAAPTPPSIGSPAIEATKIKADQIEVTQLVVKDQDGNRRIVLGAEHDPQLPEPKHGVFVYNRDASRCVRLSARQRTAGFAIEQDGKSRMTLSTGTDNYAGLFINRQPGNTEGSQIGFYFSNEGNPALVLNDETGQTRAAMMLDSHHNYHPAFALQDAKGKAFFSRHQP
jgi:hypothetical protein